MIDLLYGLLLSFIVAFFAYKKKSLNLSGLIAATAYGTSLYFFGGLFFFIVMISFFISSSLLSRFKNKDKEVLQKIHDKCGNRDYTQVIANGLPSFIFALCYYLTKQPAFVLGFGTSLAAANADTWASELGVLSKRKPVSIITGKVMTKGMSGGVTLFGTLASLLGGTFISMVFILGYNLSSLPHSQLYSLFFLCALGGFLGSIIDSILGATVQGIFYDEYTGLLTEKRFSQVENKLIKGYKYISNNLINFISVTLSSALIMLIYIML